MVDTLYDTDFVLWTEQQAARLRREAESRPNTDIDWTNIAEELESLGRRDRRAVQSLLVVLLEHLLKLEHSADPYPRRQWRVSVTHARNGVRDLLKDSPSLASQVEPPLNVAFGRARETCVAVLPPDAEVELPMTCPYALDDLLDPSWLPPNRWGINDQP